MTPKELEVAILDTIQRTYHKKYVGKIKCEHLGIGWKVILGMNNVDKPIVISAELPDEKFLKFFEQELNDRDWDTVHWFTGYKTYPDNGCPINNSCICK